jgi:hypothetical protein
VCRTIDACEALQALIDRDGLTVAGSAGQERLHPGITELRGTRLALGRLLSQLGLPDEDGTTMASPERLKARKAAAERWAAPRSGTRVSDAAREAASARWRRHA